MRWLCALAIVSCMEAAEPAPPGPPSCTSHNYFESLLGSYRLDILFVIDDSAAMAPYQAALASNAPVFMEILMSLPDIYTPDARIAVARASTGAFVDPAPCGAQAGARFLEFSHHFLVQNFSGSLPDAFTCLVNVGTSATTAQQPLAAATAALSANRDFMRDSAGLVIVVITPNDDTSLGDTASYAAALNAFKPTPRHVLASAITRTSSNRLHSFVDVFDSLGMFVSIDASSWAAAFEVVANLIIPTLGRQCVDGVLVQPTSCSFTRVQYIGTPMQQELGTLPVCAPGGQPSGACAALISDAMCYVSGIRVAVCYNGFDPTSLQQPCPYGVNDPAEGETVIVECAVECH